MTTLSNSGETGSPSQVAPFPDGSRVTAGPPVPGRLTIRQVVGWGLVFAVIVALVICFFLYGRQVVPLVGALPGEEWLTSWS